MSAKQPELDGRQKVMLEFAQAAAEEGQHFFYVLIHEPLGPLEREEKYEVPVNEALGELGEVTGGGSQMGDGDTIEYCGLDIVVNDRDRGLAVIRQSLLQCGAQDNTVIEEYIPEFNEMGL
ncbi:MAG TPA: hypothetical protein VGM98_06905 [Schlesneria sp.]|jgi:hypothetical protein